MALTPDDIVNYDFKQAMRGYAIPQVDDLLDRLADQVERSEREIDDLRQRLRETEARLGSTLETESTLKRTLVTAQEAAERALEDARQQADELRGAAEREVTEQLEAARYEAEQLTSRARAEADELSSSARAEADDLSGRARVEADEIMASARAEAEQLELAAREEADQVALRSREEATALVDAARAEADELLTRARAEGEELSWRAQETARAEVQDAREERAALEARLDELREMEHRHRAILRRHLESHLAVLDDFDALPPHRDPDHDVEAVAPAANPSLQVRVREDEPAADDQAAAEPASQAADDVDGHTSDVDDLGWLDTASRDQEHSPSEAHGEPDDGARHDGPTEGEQHDGEQQTESHDDEPQRELADEQHGVSDDGWDRGVAWPADELPSHADDAQDGAAAGLPSDGGTEPSGAWASDDAGSGQPAWAPDEAASEQPRWASDEAGSEQPAWASDDAGSEQPAWPSNEPENDAPWSVAATDDQPDGAATPAAWPHEDVAQDHGGEDAGDRSADRATETYVTGEMPAVHAADPGEGSWESGEVAAPAAEDGQRDEDADTGELEPVDPPGANTPHEGLFDHDDTDIDDALGVPSPWEADAGQRNTEDPAAAAEPEMPSPWQAAPPLDAPAAPDATLPWDTSVPSFPPPAAHEREDVGPEEGVEPAYEEPVAHPHVRPRGEQGDAQQGRDADDRSPYDEPFRADGHDQP